MITLILLPERDQEPLPDEPYDRWVTPGGNTSAEFHRQGESYLVRFPETADFTLDLAAMTVACTPVAPDKADAARSLFHNAIEPLVGNFTGGLFLHGSAVRVASGPGIAFLGDSRRGKTTLAGAFARSGHAFLTEDTVALQGAGGTYEVVPTRPVLRLFADSASHLLGRERDDEGDEKRELDASASLPFSRAKAPLAGLYILGPGDAEQVEICRLSSQSALAEIMRHAFILDVEDRQRLRGHFRRLGELADSVPCYSLDFPRVFSQLEAVVAAIAKHANQGG